MNGQTGRQAGEQAGNGRLVRRATDGQKDRQMDGRTDRRSNHLMISHSALSQLRLQLQQITSFFQHYYK
jgi:hypothetical protein